MRELVVENQEVLMIPNDFKSVNKGIVKSVSAGDFVLELNSDPKGIMVNTYCEFYTQTPHGKLYFESYAKEINGRTLLIASPAKHKFLQRRQYTRVKYINDFDIYTQGRTCRVSSLDISAGGMKFKTQDNIDINSTYTLTVPISDSVSVNCYFEPIRIERKDGYTVSGQFSFDSTKDKMMLVQYCAKRSLEIKNK